MVKYSWIVMSVINICLNIQTIVMDEEELAGPKVEYLVKEDRRGTYVVKERIEKAPDYLHFCNLTRTAVEVRFPEMKQDVFMNLLGYKGSNMIHLNRCLGVCQPGKERLACGPSKVRLMKVKMRMKSFLTGGIPRERLRDLELEDHLDCHCQRAEEEEGERTEDNQAASDWDCDQKVLSWSLGFSILLASLGGLARHYRNKLSALQDKKKTQLADQRRQFCQED